MPDYPRPPMLRNRLYMLQVPRPGASLVFHPLQNTIVAAHVHWRDRTVLCTGNPDTCLMCKAGMRKSWQGWMPAASTRLLTPFIASLSENAGRYIQALIDQRIDLRKCTVALRRLGDRRSGKVEATSLLLGDKAPELPATFDAWPSILYAMGDNPKKTPLPGTISRE